MASQSDQKNNDRNWQLKRDCNKASAVDAKIRNGSTWLWTAAAPQRHKCGGEGNTARIRTATENVERALHKMAETLYKNAQAAPQGETASAAGAGAAGSAGGSQGQGAAGKQPGDVIDAEYVDVDESHKPN